MSNLTTAAGAAAAASAVEAHNVMGMHALLGGTGGTLTHRTMLNSRRCQQYTATHMPTCGWGGGWSTVQGRSGVGALGVDVSGVGVSAHRIRVVRVGVGDV